MEHEDCPPRGDDVWDERRLVILARPRPGGGERLVLSDAGWTPGNAEGRAPAYRVEDGPHRLGSAAVRRVVRRR